MLLTIAAAAAGGKKPKEPKKPKGGDAAGSQEPVLFTAESKPLAADAAVLGDAEVRSVLFATLSACARVKPAFRSAVLEGIIAIMRQPGERSKPISHVCICAIFYR